MIYQLILIFYSVTQKRVLGAACCVLSHTLNTRTGQKRPGSGQKKALKAAFLGKANRVAAATTFLEAVGLVNVPNLALTLEKKDVFNRSH